MRVFPIICRVPLEIYLQEVWLLVRLIRELICCRIWAPFTRNRLNNSWLPPQDNVADVLTKPLSWKDFYPKARQLLGLLEEETATHETVAET